MKPWMGTPWVKEQKYTQQKSLQAKLPLNIKMHLQALNGDICLIKWGIDATLTISVLHPVALVQDFNSFQKCIA